MPNWWGALSGMHPGDAAGLETWWRQIQQGRYSGMHAQKDPALEGRWRVFAGSGPSTESSPRPNVIIYTVSN
jgi:hypothetical protein